MTWRALAVLIVVAVMAFSLGWQMPRWMAERPAKSEAPPGQEVSAPRLPEASPALRCYQSVAFDAKNQPHLTQRAWTRPEAEAAYHRAAMYLRTAEEAGLWSDRGQRAVWLAMAQLLEVLVCRGGTP